VTLLGTPLSVTVAVPSVVAQPASASDLSFEVVVTTLTGKALSFQVYGSTTVEELKMMVWESQGKGPGTACKGNWGTGEGFLQA